MIKYIILIAIGFVLLIKGADFLIDGASNIARIFHVPEIIMGLTIISIGTSMPEFCVSLTSAMNGHADIAIGNVIGSNITNLLLILGVATMIEPIKFKKETRKFEIPICMISTIIFFIMCNLGNGISRLEASILIVLCVGFILYTIFMAKNGEEYDKEDINDKKTKTTVEKKKVKSKKRVLLDVIYIILGIVALKVGGGLTTDNAVVIAELMGLSERVISVTIIAVGTSLPELTTAVVASVKKENDIAIGNVLGACVFNILLNIGVTGMISPLSYNLSYNVDMTILVLTTLVLYIFPVIPPKNEMSRMNGSVYTLMYIGYVVLLILKK